AMKDVACERHLPDQLLHTMHSPETSHQVLKRERPPAGMKRHHFTVQDEWPRGELVAGDLDDVRQAPRHVREPARPDADTLAVSMELNARAVVLELEGSAAAVSG